jgi:hypothetical protein
MMLTAIALAVVLFVLAAPLTAEAGLVSIGSDAARPCQPFVEAMRVLGYVENRNLA